MKRLFRQAWLSYKAQYRYINPKIFFTMMVVNPMLQLTYFAFMVRFAYGSNDISPWILGNAFLLASSNCVFVIGSLIRNERNLGTLKYVLGAPANGFRVFLSRSMFHVVDVFIRLVIGLAIGIFFFEFNYEGMDFFKLLLTIITGMLSGLGVGLLIGSISLITTEVHLFLNTCEQVLMLFTGALFPISRLPHPLKLVSNFLPLKRSIEASRLLLTSDYSNFYPLLAEELLLSFVLILLGYFAFAYCQYLAKRKGALDLY